MTGNCCKLGFGADLLHQLDARSSWAASNRGSPRLAGNCGSSPAPPHRRGRFPPGSLRPRTCSGRCWQRSGRPRRSESSSWSGLGGERRSARPDTPPGTCGSVQIPCPTCWESVDGIGELPFVALAFEFAQQRHQSAHAAGGAGSGATVGQRGALPVRHWQPDRGFELFDLFTGLVQVKVTSSRRFVRVAVREIQQPLHVHGRLLRRRTAVQLAGWL